MFTVHGDIIYYDGKAFAVITATPVSAGGWVLDARENIDAQAGIPLTEFDNFYTVFRNEIGDKIESDLSKAVEEIWLPEFLVERLKDRISATVLDFFKDEAEQNLEVTFDGK